MKQEIMNAGTEARRARAYIFSALANKPKLANRPFDAVAYAAALEVLG